MAHELLDHADRSSPVEVGVHRREVADVDRDGVSLDAARDECAAASGESGDRRGRLPVDHVEGGRVLETKLHQQLEEAEVGERRRPRLVGVSHRHNRSCIGWLLVHLRQRSELAEGKLVRVRRDQLAQRVLPFHWCQASVIRPELRSLGECCYVVCPGISDIADILLEVENIAASAIIKNILLMQLGLIL